MQRARYTFAATSLVRRDKKLSDVMCHVRVVLDNNVRNTHLFYFLQKTY